MIFNHDIRIDAIYGSTMALLSNVAQKVAQDNRWPSHGNFNFLLNLKIWVLDRNISILIEVAEPCVEAKFKGRIEYGEGFSRDDLAFKILQLIQHNGLLEAIEKNAIASGGSFALFASDGNLGTASYDLSIIPIADQSN